MTRIQWPGWETVRVIGRGSFGAVYEIRREVFGHWENAALKVIRIPQDESEIDELISEGYDERSITSHFEGYLQDIVREYSMMADMKGCANIVYCDDVRCIQHDNGIGWDIYIKMELLTPLTKALEKSVTDSRVARIGMDLCSALAFCEKRNVLHRDIKPQNIFLAPDGTCKLGDFGVAKTAERTTSGTRTGTCKYMAPEVYNSQPYGTKADIYSLGLVLYWLLNERRTPFLPLPPALPNFGDEDRARARRFRGEPIPAPAHGSPELQRIVLKACAFDPRDRYQHAEDMLRDLRRISEEDEEEQTEILMPDELRPDAEYTDDSAAGSLRPDAEYTELIRDGAQSVSATYPFVQQETGTERQDAGTPEEAETEYVPSVAVYEQPRPKKKKRLGLILGICGGVIALAAILLIFLLPKSGSDLASTAAPVSTSTPTASPTAEEHSEPTDAEAEYRLGMGVSLNMDSSRTGNAQVDACAAAVVLDADGRIVTCRIDVAQNKMDVTDGAVDTEATFRTKAEKKEDYGMVAYGGATYEWYQQAAAFEQYVIGMTAEEVANMETIVNDSGHIVTTDEELYATCSISIGEFKEAVVKACNDEQGMTFTSDGEFRLGLAIDSTAAESAASTAEEDGSVRMYSEFGAAVIGKDGKILAALTDVAQPQIKINAGGEITDTIFNGTKRELKEGYNMVAYSDATLEWYEQAWNFVQYALGKTAEELRATETVEDGGHIVFADETLHTSCSISIQGMIDVIAKAADNAA